MMVLVSIPAENLLRHSCPAVAASSLRVVFRTRTAGAVDNGLAMHVGLTTTRQVLPVWRLIFAA
jgi:hypothetical protein